VLDIIYRRVVDVVLRWHDSVFNNTDIYMYMYIYLIHKTELKQQPRPVTWRGEGFHGIKSQGI
jgi:hypothetical protein